MARQSRANVLGEYLFVEVRTDAGVSGWGEITTTTKVANRAVAALLRQLNALCCLGRAACSRGVGRRSRDGGRGACRRASVTLTPPWSGRKRPRARQVHPVEYAIFADDQVILIGTQQRHDWLMASSTRSVSESVSLEHEIFPPLTQPGTAFSISKSVVLLTRQPSAH